MTTQIVSNIGTYRDFNTGEVTLDIQDLLKYFKCKNWAELCQDETKVNQVINFYKSLEAINHLGKVEVPF
jgi:hypothetical protein